MFKTFDNYSSVVCDECGIRFLVPSEWKTRRIRDHETWYCPNGHGWHFTGLSEGEKLRREVKNLSTSLQSACDDRDQCMRKISAQKGANTKLRKKLEAPND